MQTKDINPFLDSFPGIAALKGKRLNYCSANLKFVNLVGYKKRDEIVGKSVYDLKCLAAEFADRFNEEDALVFSSGKARQSIHIMQYNDGKLYCVLSNKFLLRDSNNTLRLLCMGTILTNSFLKQLTNIFEQPIIDLNTNKQQYCNIYNINNLPNSSFKLTKRQQECLFYLLRGKTVIDTARKLNIAYRTAETHIDELKRKFNCSTKSQLIEKARVEGFMFWLPDSILDSNVK